MANSPDRGQAAKFWGHPTDQVGSVNDPRDQQECGVVWNEKWVYRNEDRSELWVFWHRYDFVGAFRIDPAGSCIPESLPEE